MTTSPDLRTIVITGAGSGIGRAAALRLGTPGTRVVAVDRDGDHAEAVASAVEHAGGEALAVRCDITSQADVAAALATLPAIEVLINSAGIFGDKPLARVTAEDLRVMYEVNTIGAFITTQTALPRMPDGARIVNISSRAYLGSRDHAHYVPAKAALIGLTRTLAIELGPRQIAVNAIAPGMVNTPMLAGLSTQRLAELAARYPGGRLPEAQDIAHAIAFFTDPATRFITGQVLIIDGGRSVGLSTS